jgi:hypothetical protein
MGQLVLLVVAAAWAAVLLPPLLRSRVDNRPNSSVTDFRRQLNRLQSTVPQRANASMRGMARPLAPSPLQRPAAPGRPAPATYGRRAVSRHAVPASRARHVDHAEPAQRDARAHRQIHVARTNGRDAVRRRRSNVLFVLVLAASSTLFLAATTKATVMLYAFALSFLALAGYVYLLAQLRRREEAAWPDTWPYYA